MSPDSFVGLAGSGGSAPDRAVRRSDGGHAGTAFYTEILFLPAHNYVEEKRTGPKLGAAKITGFDRVEVLDKLRDILAGLLPKGRLTVYSDIAEGSETAASTGPPEWLNRTNAFPGFVTLQDIKPMIASTGTCGFPH